MSFTEVDLDKNKHATNEQKKYINNPVNTILIIFIMHTHLSEFKTRKN